MPQYAMPEVSKSVAALVVFGAALVSTGALADGQTLLKRCAQAERLLNEQRIEDPVNAGFCLGYVGALAGALKVLNEELAPRHRACLPATGIEVGQAIRIALRFLRDNPKRQGESEAKLVIEALRAAYPCKGAARNY